MPYKSVKSETTVTRKGQVAIPAELMKNIWDTGGDEGQHRRSLWRYLVETHTSHEGLGMGRCGKIHIRRNGRKAGSVQT